MAKVTCRAVYEDKSIVCYELFNEEEQRIFSSDRAKRPECKDCIQLTAAVSKMVKDKQKTNGRWR